MGKQSHRRFFALGPDAVYYYDNDNFTNQKGSIPLEDLKRIDEGYKENYKVKSSLMKPGMSISKNNAFTIVTERKSYILEAESVSIKQKWISLLRKAISTEKPSGLVYMKLTSSSPMTRYGRSIRNAPMKKNWRPASGRHQDLTNRYASPDGSTSIQKSYGTIKKQLLAGENLPNEFYIWSTTKEQYFQFIIKKNM